MTCECRHANDGGERGDIILCFLGQWSPVCEIVLISSPPGIIGGQKSGGSKAVMQLAQIGRASQNIASRCLGIGAEMVAKAQFRIGLGHDLHQPHCSFWRHCSCVGVAFLLHDGANPMRGHAEALRRLGNVRRPYVGAGRAIQLGVSGRSDERKQYDTERHKGDRAERCPDIPRSCRCPRFMLEQSADAET